MKNTRFRTLGPLFIWALVGASTLIAGCGNSPSTEQDTNKHLTKVASLNAQYNQKFLVGTALNSDQLLGNEANVLPLVADHFNALTPENAMKWERIHPTLNTFDFEVSDALVNYATRHNMFVVGHTLVWHSQAPDWVFEHPDGTMLTRDELLARMKFHIDTVAGRYAGKIQGWDVVNEALNEDGTLRDSKWRQIIGDDYIAWAFKYAAMAAPNAELYYNDYNLFKPEKRQGVIRLVNDLKSQNIRIDGIGLQAHYSLDYPQLNQFEDSIVAFSNASMDVMVTELDVSVLPFPDENNQGADVSLDLALQDKFNPYAEGLPKEVAIQLGQRYQQIFDILNRHSDKISRVTFWGVHDGHSWRNNWPMKGRADYPLLFDRALMLKPFVTSLTRP